MQGFANCDWCYTQNNCGTFGMTGYWNFCKYPQQSAYEAQSANDKLSVLWSQIKVSAKHAIYPLITAALTESVQTTFDDVRDVMPAGRIKAIHTVGAVCQFQFSANLASPYTGVFAPNTKSIGLIRLGGTQPATTYPRIWRQVLQRRCAISKFCCFGESESFARQ